MAQDNVYTVRGVVYSFMNRKRMQTMEHYEFLEQLVFEGVRYLNINSGRHSKVVYLTVTNGIAKLPKDYIDYMAVSVQNGKYLLTLALNPGLYSSPVKKIDQDIEYVNPEDIQGTTNGYTYSAHYHNGQHYPALYSIGSGFAQGYFNIDLENGVMYVDEAVNGSQIVLQYTGHSDLCGESMIDPLYHETLLAWVNWKIAENDERKANMIELRKREFYEQQEVSASHKLPGLWDIAEILALGTHRGIKR